MAPDSDEKMDTPYWGSCDVDIQKNGHVSWQRRKLKREIIKIIIVDRDVDYHQPLGHESL